METIIKIRPVEFISSLMENIHKMLMGKKDAEITISIQDKPQKKYLRSETRDEYFARLIYKVLNSGDLYVMNVHGHYAQ